MVNKVSTSAILTSASVLHVTVKNAMTTSSNALTQVDVSADLGSVMAIMTAVICRMNRTAVSDINLAYICRLFY